MGAKKKKNQDGMKLELGQPESISTGLDPHLQRVIMKSRAGKDLDPAISQSSEDGTVTVDIIAKLKDPQKTVPGLNVVRTIGQIVTGTITVDDIESVRSDDNVMSLKLSAKLHQDLEFSVPEIQAIPDQLAAALPPGTGTIDGSGVIVGVIDHGGDVRHNDFRKEDGTTRLKFFWDQRGGENSLSPAGFGYGREFDSNAINAALQSSNPYQSLAYNPGSESHGTHVMSIAGGNGRGTGQPGVAPKADLIFVQIDADDVSDEESFGNSRKLLEAADYIFTKATELGQPAVVNISLGTHGGPHDGTTLAEQGFDTLLQQPGRAIVISAGNSWQRGSHAGGEISPGIARTLTWQIDSQDPTDNELEVWYSGTEELDVTVVTPSGQRLGPVSLDTTVNINSQGGSAGQIIHRQHDPNNGDNHIDILLDQSLPGGDWGVEVSTQGSSSVAFHAWVERDAQAGQSRFAPADDDRSYTLGSISCGEMTIAVGSYLSGVPDSELSHFTAEGPTRNGKNKPEVSAPGQFLHQLGIHAAKSLSQGSTRKSGTSMAAPHVSGLVALLMQAAGRPLSIEEIRAAVINNARQNPSSSGTAWHSRYGFGRVDATATVLTQFEPVPMSLPAAAPAAILEPAPSNGSDTVIVENIISTLASTAASARARVRIQVEIEPIEFP